MNLDMYRKQHTDILLMVDSIEKQLLPYKLKEDADGVRSMLAALVGKLNVHLAMEDEVLYPRLLGHGEEEVHCTATWLQNEVGDLKKVCQAFVDKWPSGEPVKVAPLEFSHDARSVLDRLRRRIARENNDLFPLVES